MDRTDALSLAGDKLQTKVTDNGMIDLTCIKTSKSCIDGPPRVPASLLLPTPQTAPLMLDAATAASSAHAKGVLILVGQAPTNSRMRGLMELGLPVPQPDLVSMSGSSAVVGSTVGSCSVAVVNIVGTALQLLSIIDAAVPQLHAPR
jgi:hypothetical protein